MLGRRGRGEWRSKWDHDYEGNQGANCSDAEGEHSVVNPSSYGVGASITIGRGKMNNGNKSSCSKAHGVSCFHTSISLLFFYVFTPFVVAKVGNCSYWGRELHRILKQK